MNWKSGLKLLLIPAAILALDFVSKGLVNFYIERVEYASNFFPYGGIPIFQQFLGIDFCINHVTNRGAAWGVAGGLQNLLLLVRIVVVIGLIIYLKVSSKAQEYRVPLTMVVAGGLGNILDYFIYGHVVDMFHFIFWGYSYPVFNIADASIFLGITWLLIHSFKRKKNAIPQT